MKFNYIAIITNKTSQKRLKERPVQPQLEKKENENNYFFYSKIISLTDQICSVGKRHLIVAKVATPRTRGTNTIFMAKMRGTSQSTHTQVNKTFFLLVQILLENLRSN